MYFHMAKKLYLCCKNQEIKTLGKILSQKLRYSRKGSLLGIMNVLLVT